MDALLPALGIFSAQLLVVITVAAAAEALGRVADPRLGFTYWRGVAVVCLALPSAAVVAPDASIMGVTFAVLPDDAASIAAPSGLPATGTIVWWVLAGGAVARIGWLCAGAVRLRQLRRRSRTAILTPDLEAIRSDLAPRADVRVSCDIAQPVGFGLRQPIVLLPEIFFTMDPQAQRTVACHELLHVARRDWPWIVAEEVARALFWFHPAVWWLVERIQASREQLVDRLVVARIPSKRAYMAALLTFADAPRHRAMPAAAFVRRRHLRSRLRKLLKEPVMSRRRLVWTGVVLACVMTGAVASTVMALPLGWPTTGAAAHPQQVVDGKAAGVTLPKVISEVKPKYTPEALRARIQGTVWMTAVIRTDGTPGEIKITRSLDTEHGLDKQATDALRQWRFQPGMKDGKTVPVRVTIEMRFSLKG